MSEIVLDKDSISVIPETPPDEMDFELYDDVDGVTSAVPDKTELTVTFKCIGCTKDQQYQDTLATVAQLHRPVDTRAVALQAPAT